MIVVVTHVDNKTGISVGQSAPVNGPRLPDLPGLELMWARSSQYPTNVPEFICRVTPGDYGDVSGVLATLTEAEAAEQFEVELQARADKEFKNAAAPIIEQRNALLDQSDKYVLEDFPLTPEKKAEWRAYRQALRDITLQETFPHSVDWPTSP